MVSPGQLPSCLVDDSTSALPSLIDDILSPGTLPKDSLSALEASDTALSDISPGCLSAGLSPVFAAESPLSSVTTTTPALTLQRQRPALHKPVPSAEPPTSPPPLLPTATSSAVNTQSTGTPPRLRKQHSPASASPAGQSSASSTAKRMWQLDDFDLGRCIGVGSFGRIVVARERQSRAVVVLKAMKKRRIERLKVQRHVAHEIEIQAHLRHPNILQLFGFFWDASHIFMILEHAPRGDLCHLLKKQPHRCLSECVAAPLVAQVMDAIEYCHRMHVIHRDLKPQNVLVGQNYQVKLADFGWAVHTYPDQQRWTLCGTLDYLPPEIVHATRGHSFAVDIWGLGVLTYELLLGCPPFSASTCEETYRRILKVGPVFSSKEYDDDRGEGSDRTRQISARAKSFICKLLEKEPADRLPLREALAHPWLKEFTQEFGSARYGPAAHAGA